MSAKKREFNDFSFRPFKNLKKIFDNKGLDISPQPAPPKQGEPPSDEELFNDAMKHVREIREFREIPVNRKKTVPSRKIRSTEHDALKALEDIVQGKRPMRLPDTQEYVQWRNKDYRSDITSRLHEGHYSVQDCLDLHGCVIEEAASEIERFIKDSRKMGNRCIKIIHGRGLRSPKGPVLKTAVVKWLSGRHRKQVIAFVSARQCDGGLGALYVLLR